MILAIDTSTATVSVALYDGTEILGESTYKSLNRHTVLLAPTVLFTDYQFDNKYKDKNRNNLHF